MWHEGENWEKVKFTWYIKSVCFSINQLSTHCYLGHWELGRTGVALPTENCKGDLPFPKLSLYFVLEMLANSPWNLESHRGNRESLELKHIASYGQLTEFTSRFFMDWLGYLSKLLNVLMTHFLIGELLIVLYSVAEKSKWVVYVRIL
jgi:hypothetical protein